MLMAVQDSYVLMVQPDDILISPREVDEHFGTMVCFHSRYALGDSHNYMDKDDFLREMYLNTVGHDEPGMDRYEHGKHCEQPVPARAKDGRTGGGRRHAECNL